MANLSCYKYVCIDMSYRDIGVCVSLLKDNCLNIINSFDIKSEPLGNSFDDYIKASKDLFKSLERIESTIAKADYVFIEMPCFTQSAKAAIAIGMCWGVLSRLQGKHNIIFIEPSALKKWSGSKSGDKKEKVKQKVIERGYIGSTSNDNIVDAIGISFMINDLVSTIKYETNRK